MMKISAIAFLAAAASVSGFAPSAPQFGNVALKASMADMVGGEGPEPMPFSPSKTSKNFDPFGLAERAPENLNWYREAELKHCRMAMLATVGFVVPEFVRVPGQAYSFENIPHVIEAHDKLPESMIQIFGWISFLEAVSFGALANMNEFDRQPGNFGFDPLGLYPTDPEKQKEMQLSELKNGRLAMIAIGGMVAGVFGSINKKRKMKYAALAIAALFGVAEAKISAKDMKTLQSRAQQGKVNKQTLMRGATPYSPAAKRKMDEQEEWEINGYYSIEFDTCLSLKTANENLFEDDMVYYAANGLVTSATSYITFTVCETKNCYYQSSDQKMTFITDIATYFTALAEYLPNQVKTYCEGCEENQDYCEGNLQMDDQAQDEAEEDEASEEEEEESGDEEDGEDRKLLSFDANRRRLGNQRVVEYINCNQCNAYECFAEDENDRKLDEEVVYDMDGAVEWLNDLAECKELEDVVYGDVALYAGLMCNSKGTGVEIAVFMDDECSLYTTVKSFSDVMSYDDKQYFSMSQDIVQYTFTNKFDCENVEIEYTNPYEENQDEQEEEEDDGEAPEAAEYCQDLFEETVDMYDCGADQDADEEEEAEDEDENAATYEWYNYELTQDQADDAQAVCQVLNGWDQDAGKSKSYQGKTIYDSKSSGTLYTYKKGKNSSNGGGAGGTAFIVILSLLVVGAIGFFVFKKKSEDSKKAPLINANNNGQLA